MEYQDFETFSEEKKTKKKPKRIYWLALILVIVLFLFLFLWGRSIYLDLI